MKFKLQYLAFLIASGLFLSGCYTQVKTVQPERGYYPASTQPAPDRRAPVEQRAGQIVNEEDYVVGYEDGWDDAEEYYFKDYEAKEWYMNYGIDLAHDRYVRRSYSSVHHNYYPYHFSSWYTPPFYRYYGPAYYGHSYFAVRFFRPHFSVGFGWAYHDPYRFYHDPYSYYGSYYSGYWGYSGYNGRPVIVYNTRTVQRDYGPRSTGLATRGNAVRNRTSSIQNSRSAIRSNARSTQVSRNRSTVNRTRSASSIRSNATTRTNSRSTVNRSRTNTNRSSGTVNRTRSNNNSSGSVNRNRSSSNNRSSGTVNRSNSSSRSSGTSTNRSRSNNNDRKQATVGSTSSRTSTYVAPRSEDNRVNVGSNTTINRRSVVVNRTVNQSAVNRRVENATVRNRVGSSVSRVGNVNRSQNRSSGFLKSLGRALGNAALEGITNTKRSSSSGVTRTRSSNSSSRSTVNRSSSSNRSSNGTVNRSSSNNRSSSGSSSRNRSSSSNNRN